MKKIILVGGGRLGYFLARVFLGKGYAVTIVTDDREEAVFLARRIRAVVVFGDAGDPRVLENAEAASADALLSVTPRDHVNLVVCQMATLLFHVPRVLAVASDPENEDLFGELGVSAFSPTKIIASLIEQRTEFEEITSVLPVGEAKITVTEIILPDSSRVCGKPLRDIPLPENSLVGAVMRDGKPVVPRGDTVLHPRDRLIIIALPENQGEVLRIFMNAK